MKKNGQLRLIFLLVWLLWLAWPYSTEPAPQYGLPKSGQTTIYHQPSLPYNLGDDGAIQAGFPISGPQYTDNGNGTVTDNGTGLIWQQNDSGEQAFGGYAGPMTWYDAFGYVNAMNSSAYAGRTDWHLPNILELMSILSFNSQYLSIEQAYFPIGRAEHYWTSSSFVGNPPAEKWAIQFRGGFSQFGYSPTVYYFYVRAVAGGLTDVGSQWGLPVSGQNISYHDGDDGDIQAGYPLSGERFVLDQDGTAYDRATGLSWQLSDSVTYKLPGYPFGILNWEDTFGYVRQLNINNYCGHSDWRVPNIKELTSISDFSKWVPSFWSVFATGSATRYWSSTTDAYTDGTSNRAFWVDFINGIFEIWNADKSTELYLKAVRGPDGVAPVPTPTPITNLRFFLDSGDYNGDGVSDIALFRGGSGLWAIRDVSRFYFGKEGDIPVPGDYDGDGTTDIGVFRSSHGLWGILGVSRVYFGSSGDLPVPGDYVGDGTCRVGLYRPSNGLWAIREVSRIYYGSSSDIPVPGYYTGNRKKSIGVFRPESGLWALFGVSRTYYGRSGDIPVPGDYRGIDRDSIGIFRPESGLWSIKDYTRNYFGKPSDIPVPGNYSGITAGEVGIFRPESGLWALEYFGRIYFGTSGDIPISTFSRD